jgi:hypothetical protein
VSLEFRILDFNLAADSGTTVTASSEDANFPASNIAKPFRSKVYRSHLNGTFVIASTNAKVDFTRNGSTYAATLSSGTYTGITLAAEIVSKMNTAAGGSYVSCSKSLSTGLWTISCTGSTFSLLFATGTNVANSIASTLGFAASDRTGALTYTGSNIAIHTSERIVFDMGTTEGVDSAAILFDSVLGPKLTANAVLKFEANATNAWTAPAVSQTVALDTSYDVATYFWSATQSYRYWSLLITDPKNSNLCVEIGKVILALATQLSQTPDAGFQASALDRSKITQTPYGHRYADVYPRLRTFDFTYSHLPSADLETLDLMHARLGATTPIAVALDPTSTLWDKDRFFVYGYLKPEFKPKQSFYDYWDLQGFSIEESP